MIGGYSFLLMGHLFILVEFFAIYMWVIVILKKVVVLNVCIILMSIS